MSSFLFPDLNVWLALVHRIHPHNPFARAWESHLPADTQLCFCRFTQLGLLRLLTNSAAMQADVLTQSRAWAIYDQLLGQPTVQFLPEPPEVELAFRRRSSHPQASTKQWADAYLAAFAEVAQATLVTFDKALASSERNSILLG